MSSISGGIVIPEILIIDEYKKENQTKTIQYIDLDKYHLKINLQSKKKEDFLKEIKMSFLLSLKIFVMLKFHQKNISGSKDYNESFFKKLDIIENNILDGQSFNETVKNNNLKVISIENINKKKENLNKDKISNLSDNLFKKDL